MTLGPWLFLAVLVVVIGVVVYWSNRREQRPIIWPTEHGRVMRWERARGEYWAERRYANGEMELHVAELRALEVQRRHRVAQVFDARASIVPRLNPARFPDAPRDASAEQGAPAASPPRNTPNAAGKQERSAAPSARNRGNFADAVAHRSPARRDGALAALRHPSFLVGIKR